MKRILLNVGTREEILAELDRYGSDRAQAGKTERAAELADAIRAIRDDGDTEVHVEHAIYRVLGVGESLSDWENPARARHGDTPVAERLHSS